MKQGFTLTELLAVIVILGIIASISMPLIAKTISNTEKTAFINNATTLKKTAVLDYRGALLEGKQGGVVYTFTNKVVTSSVIGRKLEIGGDAPENGRLVIRNDGRIALAIHNGQYCVYDLNGEIKTEELELTACLLKAPIPE